MLRIPDENGQRSGGKTGSSTNQVDLSKFCIGAASR